MCLTLDLNKNFIATIRQYTIHIEIFTVTKASCNEPGEAYLKPSAEFSLILHA
jgi:hypothetical protein